MDLSVYTLYTVHTPLWGGALCCWLRSQPSSKAGFKYHLPGILPEAPFLLLPNSTIFSLHVYCHLPNSALSVYGLLLRGGGNVHSRAFQSAAKGTFERFLSLLIKTSWDAIRPAWICMNCALWRYISEIPIAKHYLAGFANRQKDPFLFCLAWFLKWNRNVFGQSRKDPLSQMPHRLLPWWCCLSIQGVSEIVSPTMYLLGDEETLQHTHGGPEKPRQAKVIVWKPQRNHGRKTVRGSTEKGKA